MNAEVTRWAILAFALGVLMSGCAGAGNQPVQAREQSDFLRRFHSSSQDRTARNYMQVKSAPRTEMSGAP